MIRLALRLLTIAAPMLVAACSGPVAVGTLDTSAGHARLFNDSSTRVFSLSAEGRKPVTLGDLRDARFVGAWGGGIFVTAVVAGSTAECRLAYVLVDITPGATSPANGLPDCATTTFAFDGTSLVATSSGAKPRIWRFVSGFLYGPFEPTATRSRAALRHQTSIPNDGNQDALLKDEFSPPPVSGEAGEDVIPQSVGVKQVPRPTVVNLR